MPVCCADTHCHLDDRAYSNDLDAVLTRAWEAGVPEIFLPAESYESAQAVLELAARDSRLHACAGIHPHRAGEVDIQSTEAAWRELAAKPEVAAIAEIGLDYYYGRSPREAQQSVLAFFLDLAAAVNKPVCLHVRDAHAELKRMLRDHRVTRGLIHCFTGSYVDARDYLDRGLMISFSGILTFKPAGTLRDIFAKLPRDRVVLETDGPYLAPVPMRGGRNEPAYVRHVFETACGLWKADPEQAAGQIAANVRSLFFP